MRWRDLIVGGSAALAVAGCGATPSQAPFPQAKKLDAATSGVAAACGESYQVSAFAGGNRGDLSSFEETATTAARKLAGVYNRNPAWIYQGETIRQLVQDGILMLRGCGLNRAAAALSRATGESDR